MHSGFHDIPAAAGAEIITSTSAPPLLLSINHQILDTTTTTQQRLFLHDHHFLPPHHHHYAAAAAASSPYFPLNFKLGLNEFNEEDGSNNLLIRGSEQYSEPRQQHPSLGMLHSWQPHQQQDSPKQPRFWEGAQVSNENSSERQQQQDLEMSNQKEMSTKSRSVHFGELEAIYNNNNKPLIEDENPTVHVAIEEEEEEASASASLKNNSTTPKKRRKKKKKNKKGSSSYKKLFSPMTEFFGNLVKQVMEHQESLHKKFSEAIERLDEERRAREVAWRNQELAHLEEEAEARARERASATNREAIIVSYLEKITGQTIQLNYPEDLSVDR